jgi:hypothetical protein
MIVPRQPARGALDNGRLRIPVPAVAARSGCVAVRGAFFACMLGVCQGPAPLYPACAASRHVARRRLWRPRSVSCDVTIVICPNPGHSHVQVDSTGHRSGPDRECAQPRINSAGFRFITDGFRFVSIGFRFMPSGFSFISVGFRFMPSGFSFMPNGFRFIPSGFRFISSGFRFMLSGFRCPPRGFRCLPSGFRGPRET